MIIFFFFLKTVINFGLRFFCINKRLVILKRKNREVRAKKVYISKEAFRLVLLSPLKIQTMEQKLLVTDRTILGCKS